MPLSHTASNFDSSTELLRIETDLFELTIAGKPFHATVERLSLHRGGEEAAGSAGGASDEGRIPAAFSAAARSLRLTLRRVELFSPQTGRLEVWEQGTPAYPCFYETGAYEFTLVKTDPVSELAFYHENVNLRRRIKPRGRSVLSGTLDFGSEIGESELEIRLDGRPLLAIGIEVFPAKLDYRRDYARLIGEVDDEAYDLSFDFLRRTYRPAESAERPRQSLAEFQAILRAVFGRMEDAVRRIGAHPHYRLEAERRLRESVRAKRTDRRSLEDLRRHPQRLRREEGGWLEIRPRSGAEPEAPGARREAEPRRGREAEAARYTPTHLLEARRTVSYDTDENRFLRWMLERTAGRIDRLQRELREGSARRDPLLDRELERIKRRIGRMLDADYLRAAGPMRGGGASLVLQMAPGYREMYKLHLLLLRGLAIREGLLRLSVKDMAQLYEYWCFLKLHRLLADRCRVVRREGSGIRRGGLFPTLIRGRGSRIEYELPHSGARLALLYNPSLLGRSRPTTEQKPDLLLTLYTPDGGASGERSVNGGETGRTTGAGGRIPARETSFVLDAKYRLDPAEPGTSYERAYASPGPLEEDINVMHRYRDAIVRRGADTGEYERRVEQACVLFPYGNESEYAEHHFYRSIGRVGVGALPFLPGSTALAERWLDGVLGLPGAEANG
ncbi:DUF2357 domain-containing protein [Saccharibacillus sp. CPCC 101409]|uniref:DUF2357 domain-containing protein n=1 Tax=Saccharibacillus sp. CPCC 101409 TaxID=3058041 RepID=UPI002671537A|nr:DUF2357 domain-containing protein [Saccharibacillus sp. CPCC 101409]MDO3408426.1 DUF2357 domain-containing protein [Saccharibacillus sp. CPCC 101409]